MWLLFLFLWNWAPSNVTELSVSPRHFPQGYCKSSHMNSLHLSAATRVKLKSGGPQFCLVGQRGGRGWMKWSEALRKGGNYCLVGKHTWQREVAHWQDTAAPIITSQNASAATQGRLQDAFHFHTQSSTFTIFITAHVQTPTWRISTESLHH